MSPFSAFCTSINLMKQGWICCWLHNRIYTKALWLKRKEGMEVRLLVSRPSTATSATIILSTPCCMSANIRWLAELKFYEVLILIHSRVKGYWCSVFLFSSAFYVIKKLTYLLCVHNYAAKLNNYFQNPNIITKKSLSFVENLWDRALIPLTNDDTISYYMSWTRDWKIVIK